MRKILIVGGTSNVGRCLKNAFSTTHEVITAGRKDCDIRMDLKKPESEIQFPEYLDVIIHTASQFGVQSDREILETEDINVLGTLKLCQAAVRQKAKHFIFISSIYSSVSSSSGHYNFYSLSKRHAEEVASLYCSKHKLPLTILRPSPLYGAYEGFRVHQPFFYSMVDKAEKGEDICLYGRHDPARNYLHVDDLAEIIGRIVDDKLEGTYSCTHTDDVTYSQIAHAAFSAFKTHGKVFFLEDKPDIPDSIFEKEFTLYKKIDFYPRISIQEGLNDLVKSRITHK